MQTVKPGTALCIDRGLEVREHAYWTPAFATSPELTGAGVDGAADLLEDRLSHTVRLRLRADVPVGAYLSGGLDSSVISSLVRTSESSPLETFSVAFDDPAFDESAEQARMATLLGTRHHTVVCDNAAIAGSLADVVWHCEAPLLRTAPVPLFLLSGLVRDEGMKVVLTGEGADELLAGYSIFKEDKVRRFWGARPRVDHASGIARSPAPRGQRRRRPCVRDVAQLLRPRPCQHRRPVLLARDPLAEHGVVDARARAGPPFGAGRRRHRRRPRRADPAGLVSLGPACPGAMARDRDLPLALPPRLPR